jgi:dihydrodipicolinate synthase/N-acetylneuraminate lyase
MFKANGIIPIVPTPFTEEGAVDLVEMAPLLEFAVESRVCAVCLPAYASEFYKLVHSERRELIYEAIRVLRGRLPVVAQINDANIGSAAESAREFERAGASAISVAVPRMFSLPEGDLFRYFERVLAVINVPLVIQDFNPTGATVSVDFIKRLNRQHPHFRYVKLEESLMAAKVRSIVDQTAGAVGVIEGWGGTYILELIDAGICGVMPGLGVSDLLQKVWEYARAGEKDAAYEIFHGVLPQITFSLQSLEFFHHVEKALLVARGVLRQAHVRDATVTVDEVDRGHIQFLIDKIVALAERTRRIDVSPNDGRRNASPGISGKSPARSC